MGRVNRLMERRVLRRAADQALLTSMTQGPDSAAAGQPGGAPDQDFQYTRSDPTDTDASYDHEPVTAPIPVTDVADELPVGSVEVLPEPVDVYDVYDLVPDQPDDSGSDGAGELRADGDAARLDTVEASDPVVSRPLRARPLGEDALVHPAAAMPMPEFRPQPWYRSRQAATLIAAAAIVAVVGGGWLMVRSPSTTAEQSKFEAPTSAPPAPSTVAPTAVSAAQQPPAPPPPPPPPPPTAEPVYSGPQRQYSEPRRSVPPPAQKPEIGETRTPATRAPISVAPVPRPVAGSGSNTPGEQPRRRGCFGFC